jgi:hypothetical protein
MQVERYIWIGLAILIAAFLLGIAAEKLLLE